MNEHELALQARVPAGETVIINLHKEAGHRALVRWAKACGRYVRIDRLGPWGNPYRIPEDGDRQAVVRRCAEEHLPAHPELLARLEGGELRGGKVLGCWCAPPEGLTAESPPGTCHGQVLLAGVRRVTRVGERTR